MLYTTVSRLSSSKATSCGVLRRLPQRTKSQLRKLPFETRRCDNALQHVERSPKGGFHYSRAIRSGNNFVNSIMRDYNQLTCNDDMPEEPFSLSLMKEAIWALKSLFVFLIKQPSQLKYIKWPGFQSTLKTATLTLVLVALLVIALLCCVCPQLYAGFASQKNPMTMDWHSSKLLSVYDPALTL